LVGVRAHAERSVDKDRYVFSSFCGEKSCGCQRESGEERKLKPKLEGWNESPSPKGALREFPQ
jgi:hypothetical protein